jgi:methyltransferase (TIGR00027 family)
MRPGWPPRRPCAAVWPSVPEPAPALPPVGVTGVGVAVLRALETARPDRLFADPWAERFVRAAGLGDRLEQSADARHPLGLWIAVRTRFLDDVVLDACAQGCTQVVVAGAGVDTRAFRLPWPEGIRLWELDLPDVLAFKEAVVTEGGWQAACTRTVVPLDLSQDWPSRLLGAGFDRTRPAVWLAEGLLAYLAAHTRDHLVGGAAQLSAPGSRLGVTLARAGRLQAWQAAHPDGATRPGDFVSLWQSEAPDDAVAWLASLGWQARLFEAAERAAAYGRPVPDDSVPPGPRLVSATLL